MPSMARVVPFRGVRYNPSRVRLSEVVAPPYDVVSPEQQRSYHDRSPVNVMHLELGLPEGPDEHGRDRYARAAYLLREWLRDGILEREPRPAYYVYEEGFELGGRHLTRRGVFAAVGLEPWDRDVVLPHEHTLPKPKADRLSLLRATQAQISPIYTFFDDADGSYRDWISRATARQADAAVSLPASSVVEVATEHRLWVVGDPDACRALESVMSPRQLFIADGHHRYETALAYQQERRATAGAGRREPWDDVLMLLVASEDPGLVILPIHRVVRVPDRLDRERLIAGLSRLFDVAWASREAVLERFAASGTGDGEPIAERPSFGVLGLRKGEGAIVTLREGASVEREMPREVSAAWRALDVSVLHALILEPLLGIGPEQVASQQYVAYERDARAAASALDHGADLVFLMRPTRVTQVRDVARAHDRMPQKSTYFYPKVATGIVMYPLSEP